MAQILQVEVVRHPTKALKTAVETARLLEEILEHFEYKGNWKVFLNHQVTKKGDFKFQVVNRKGSSVVCRTKPGDNGTCWEIVLSPPPGYAVGRVIEDLRTVPANAKLLRVPMMRRSAPSSTPSEIILPAKRLNDVPLRDFDALQKFLDDKSPAAPSIIQPIGLTREQMDAHVSGNVLEIPDVPIPEPTPEPQDVMPPKTHSMPLSIKELKFTQKIKHHNPVLINGLVALSLNVKDSHVKRREAIDCMVSELELVKFCDKSTVYADAVKTATAIINGLIEKGWATRWYSVSSLGYRVREAVKGYNVTPAGAEKIRELQPQLPQTIIKRIPKELLESAALAVPAIRPPESPAPTTSKIEKMKKLFDDLNARNKALAECMAACTAQQQKVDAINFELAPTQKEIDDLEAQIAAKREKMAQGLQSKADLELELKFYSDLKNEEEQAVTDIRKEMEGLVS